MDYIDKAILDYDTKTIKQARECIIKLADKNKKLVESLSIAVTVLEEIATYMDNKPVLQNNYINIYLKLKVKALEALQRIREAT